MSPGDDANGNAVQDVDSVVGRGPIFQKIMQKIRIRRGTKVSESDNRMLSPGKVLAHNGISRIECHGRGSLLAHDGMSDNRMFSDVSGSFFLANRSFAGSNEGYQFCP
jgi:hypothetical protein